MKLTYIMPDWDDYVDADFDFIKDEFSTETREARREVYLHELMGDETPCDGILVSLAQILKGKGALKNINAENEQHPNVRDMMRIPQKLLLIGDCGAFTYKDEIEPPFSPEGAAELYEKLGFNVGASVDHMVFGEKIIEELDGSKKKAPITEEDQKERIKLTISNAKAFIDIVRKKNYSFTPLGTIQGLTPKDYADGFRQYVEFGYEYVALGSLVPKNDEEIKNVIIAVGEEYNKLSEKKRQSIKIHLFGVHRPKLYKYYKKNGIRSFDSISYFRKAWLRSDKNYLGVNGEWYPAIRVPQVDNPVNMKKLLKDGIDLEYAKKKERLALDSLMRYSEGQASLKTTLKNVLDYDILFTRSSEDGEKIRNSYTRTLIDRPWEQCNCPICRDIGIHTLIFRGTNRNKRRGFHNTIGLYKELSNQKF